MPRNSGHEVVCAEIHNSGARTEQIPKAEEEQAVMSPHLTHRPREGVIFGVVAGLPVRLAIQRNESGIA
jgi:hypothetical protein